MKSTTLKFENNNLIITIMESSDEIILRYNFTDTLNESKSKTKSVKLKKDSKGDIKKLIKKLGTKKFSKDDIDDEVLKIKSKGEVKELIDDDGNAKREYVDSFNEEEDDEMAAVADPGNPDPHFDLRDEDDKDDYE
jgi:hypothetical protein